MICKHIKHDGNDVKTQKTHNDGHLFHVSPKCIRPAQIQQIRNIMILQKQNLYSYKLISVNTLYYYKVSAKYSIPAHMTRWCTVSLSICLTWLCMNCGINFCLWLKQDVHALSSWCPDVIIFFLRHLDAYNEMVVSSYLNGRDTDVCSLCSRVARFSQQNPPNCYSKLAQK